MEPPKDPNFWTTFVSKYWPHILTGTGITISLVLKKLRNSIWGLIKTIARWVLDGAQEAKLDYETKRALDDIGRAASYAAIDASRAVDKVEQMSKENREWMESAKITIFGSLSDVHEKANAANITAARLEGRVEAIEKRLP